MVGINSARLKQHAKQSAGASSGAMTANALIDTGHEAIRAVTELIDGTILASTHSINYDFPC